MKKRIITISREFGSGGRTIGKALAEDNAPIVFVGKSSIIIDSEEKALNELANYNVPLDNMIGGEYL